MGLASGKRQMCGLSAEQVKPVGQMPSSHSLVQTELPGRHSPDWQSIDPLQLSPRLPIPASPQRSTPVDSSGTQPNPSPQPPWVLQDWVQMGEGAPESQTPLRQVLGSTGQLAPIGSEPMMSPGGLQIGTEEPKAI
jgi:hypothetical protein